MRKLKNVSLALVLTPLLFTGCMQEKVSEITPKSVDKNVTLQEKVVPNTTLSASSQPIHLHENQNHQQPTITPLKITANEVISHRNSVESSDLDMLVQMVEENMNHTISGKEGSYTSSVEVNDDWVEMTKEEEIILTAKNYLGTEYIWAANGPYAFDCSGFTKYVYKKNGITLPRYSGHQAKVGVKVSYNELEKGDLVFFDTEKKFQKKVNHVGIYMGNGKFIHASSAKKKVIITSFNQKTFYKKRFLWGERVVDSSRSYASL